MNSATACVLVVDDNAHDLATYSRWLRACTQHRLTVLTASSVVTALALVLERKPDCIVLDNELRDATGLEFIAELAELGLEPPVVAITGSGSEKIAVEFMKAGARDYLVKAQMSASDLCAAVVKQLSPQAIRHQLALARDRERSTNAALGVALKRVSFLAETGKIFAATRSYEELIELAVTCALPFLAHVCILDLLEGGVLYRVAAHADGDARLTDARARLSMAAPGNDRFVDAAGANRGAPLYLSDAGALSQAARGDADLAILIAAGLTTAAFFTLQFSGPVIGVLMLGTTRAGGFSDEERLVLDDYAQRVGVAIANARIAESERVQRKLAESSKRRLTFQSRISALFARSLDWESTLEKLMKLITTSFSDSAAIFIIDKPSEAIRLVASTTHDATLGKAIARYYTDFPPLLTDGVGVGPVVRTGRSQFFATDLLDYREDSVQNHRRAALLADWAPVSAICVPLHVRGTVVGALSLVRDISLTAFTTVDVAIAEDVARRTAIYMEIGRLYDNEHGIAVALQQALLPALLPSVSDLLFGVRYFAGAEGTDVGGDWYDIIEVDRNRMVITIGDVIGSGVKAATAMGEYRDYLRSYAFEGFGPAVALTRLNIMANALRSESFATCTSIVLDRQTRRFRYSSAGHPPAMLRLPDGSVRVLDGASSMPIGAWPKTQYREETLEMPIGATLVLYTDGLVETRRRSASDGVDVLRVALGRSSPDIELMLDGMLRDVAPDRSDDIAILAIEMLPVQHNDLKRWVFGHLDRVIMRKIRMEYDELLEASAADDADIYGAHLILSELLANVVRHAPGPFRLEVEWTHEYPQLRLYDNGPGSAVNTAFAAPEDRLSSSGRGLFLISRTSRSFVMAARPSGGLVSTVTLPVRRKSAEPQLVLS